MYFLDKNIDMFGSGGDHHEQGGKEAYEREVNIVKAHCESKFTHVTTHQSCTRSHGNESNRKG